jgi:hypothetical protein
MNEHAGGPWMRRRQAGHHLTEDELVRLHSLRATEAHGGAARLMAHVHACGRCADALRDLEQTLASLTADVAEAADAHVSQERLDRQQDAIARRIGDLPGRVLHFPAPAPVVRTRSNSRRWMAMAAACGLFFGIAAGRLIGPTGPPTTQRLPSWGVHPSTAAPDLRLAEPALQEEEHLLYEVDAAIAQDRARAFRVLDDLTPRLADGPSRGRR